jgi:hypothetical protein
LLTGLNKKKKLISYSLSFILQDKEYFSSDLQIDFSDRYSCFGTLRCMTDRLHWKQTVPEFLSLQVEILTFWLEEIFKKIQWEMQRDIVTW